MTIDASKSPTPAWQRKAMAALVAVLLVVVAYMVWSKELHHGAPATSSRPAATAPSPASRSTSASPTTSTTIPGGLPVSSRDPFGS